MLKISRKNLINFILACCLVLLVSNSLSCFKTPVQNTLRPSLSLWNLIKREINGMFFYHSNMIKAITLNGQIEVLRKQLFDLRELNQENIRLRELLNFKQKSPLRLVAARVIARSPDNWSSSIIIDKGRYNGVKLGMVVVNSVGLVGRIVEALQNSSKVLLLSDPNLGVSSIIQSSRQEGLVSGTLGANLIMRYLPEDTQINIGDIVVSSELSQIYPKGLLIGKVINIGQEFSGLNRYAIIRPAVNLSNLEEVLVILQ